MLIVFINTTQTASDLLSSGYKLSQNLKKDFGVLAYVDDEKKVEVQRTIIHDFLAEKGFQDIPIFVKAGSVIKLAVDCEELEASLLMMQWSDSQNKQLRNYLKFCRDLRIPYLFFKENFAEMNFEKVLVPVGFLIEEYEKTQFASAFGRFCDSEITILQANDYGSKAKTTIEKMKLIFDKFELKYTQEKAKADSFKLDKEAIQKAENESFSIVIVSASRDYGLDDIVFGPKEMHLIKKSKFPLLLINPRGDLYTLCD